MGGTEIQLVQRIAVDGTITPAPEASASAPRATMIAGSGGDTVVKGRAEVTAARMTSIDAVAAAANSEQPNVSRLTGDGGTITIVFSDIESSTEMATQLGDTKWFAVLHQHNEIIRRVVKRYHGTEIKSQGDGFMLTFPSARSAVLAMCEAQREFGVYAAEHPETPIRVRVGVHTGEAIRDAGGDLFGRHIILASRIANLAHGGEIVASSITKEIASGRGDLQFSNPREVQIKGFEELHHVYDVIWNKFDDARADAAKGEPDGD
jgi:class 3 adenylate cyclase